MSCQSQETAPPGTHVGLDPGNGGGGVEPPVGHARLSFPPGEKKLKFKFNFAQHSTTGMMKS